MKLVIDQGNTAAKVAIYKEQKMEFFCRCEELNEAFIERLCADYAIEAAIYSSVKNRSERVIEYLRSYPFPLIEFTADTPLPITIAYKTPQTLGLDRVAAVVGAWELNPNQPSFVVDAGTAVTYDLIDEFGCYLGGNISPGLELRNKSLHSFTDKLPLIRLEGDILSLGDSTETALRAGIVNGLLFEIERYIETVKESFTLVSFFLTGGDAKYLANRLKYHIFAEPNLVLIGLKRIVEYNVEK